MMIGVRGGRCWLAGSGREEQRQLRVILSDIVGTIGDERSRVDLWAPGERRGILQHTLKCIKSTSIVQMKKSEINLINQSKIGSGNV